MSGTIFFRLLDAEDKGLALLQAVDALPQEPTPESIITKSRSFQQVPGSPFSYWVNESIRKKFAQLELLESDSRTAKQGLATAEDFRFVRTMWEGNLSKRKTPQVFPFAKGGGFSKFYADIYLSVNWSNSGNEIAAFPRAYIRNADYYFRPGLTWSLRSQKGLSVRLIPRGCTFGHKGPSIFLKDDNLQEILSLLAIANSQAFLALVELQMAFGSYEVGVLQRTPIPELNKESKINLADLAHRSWLLKRDLDTSTQTSHAFILPALLQTKGTTLTGRAQSWTTRITATEQQLSDIQQEIDDIAFKLYDISPEEISSNQQSIATEVETEEDEDTIEPADLSALTHSLIEYNLGTALGRFDIRLATEEREQPPEPEPFDPLPACSPGMLVANNNLPPTSPEELPPNYPVDIPFNGILVDDESHPNDIIRRIRPVFDIIFSDQAGDIEQEACQHLKTASLRDYFAKPNAFFTQHLSRYSKSRRYAPLYWPLSTPSGSYTLWIYYHRLTDQTLYTAINDHLEPKLRQTTQTVTQLLSQPNRSSADSQTLETLQTLEQELTDLRDQLLRIAQLPYKPNLNDGVQITAAPLWPLFRLKKWQDKLKDTWEALETGDYDWAHLAYSIWPERVQEKCKKDRSLAIAHNLESLYEPPPETTPKKKKRK